MRQPSFDASLFRFFQVRGADGAAPSIPSSELILRARTTAPDEAATALGTRDVIKIVRLRSLSAQPVLFEEIYIPAQRFDGLDRLEDGEFGPLLYPLYFERFNTLVTRATDDLSFGHADAQVARSLGIKAGDALAIIRRTAFDINATPVEWRIARGSAARFHYRTEIK